MATTAKSSARKRQYVLVVKTEKGAEVGFLNPTSLPGFEDSSKEWLEKAAKPILEQGNIIPASGFAKDSRKEYISLQASLDPVAEEAGFEDGILMPFYFLQPWSKGKKKSVDWFVRKLTERKLIIVKRRLKSALTKAQLKKLTPERLERIFFPGGEEIKY